MKTGLVVAGVALVLSVLGAIVIPGLLPSSRGGPTVWHPPRVLSEIANAQRDYFFNDRDGNGKQDYWRRDIAGLGSVKDLRDGSSSKLLYSLFALADDRPSFDTEVVGPKAPVDGYWYRAIRHAHEPPLNPTRFAACGFPDRYPQSGRFTYVLDEHDVIYMKDLGKGGGVEVFPPNPFGEGWQKVP